MDTIAAGGRALDLDHLLDPALLRTFVAVVDEGTVTAAARELGLGQSALTRHLQRLQRDLGLALFAPEGARLRLTPAGQAWLPVARSLLAAHAHARQAARILAAGRLTELSLGAPGTTLIDVVIPFLTVLGEGDPAVRVTETQLDDSLQDSVARLDLVVLPSTPPDDVAALPLRSMPVWACVAPGHPWADRDELDAAELAGARLVLPSRSFKARRVFDAALEVAGAAPRQVVEANSGRVAQALAANGTAVAVVTEDPAFGLRPLPIRAGGRRLEVHLHAVWRRDHFAAEEIAGVAAQLRAFVRRRYDVAAAPSDAAGASSRSASSRSSPASNGASA